MTGNADYLRGSHRARGFASETQGGAELQALGWLLAGNSPGPGLDWTAILHLARLHSVSPLLFWRLEKEGQGRGRDAGVSADVWEELESDFYMAAARGMLLDRQLAEVLRVLSQTRTRTLVLKGAAIGTFYADPALRPYGDLDLLVPQSQLGRAEEALKRLGYRYTHPKAWWLSRHYHLPPMESDKGWRVVEVHWRLEHNDVTGCLPADDLWTRAVPWAVSGQQALRLDAVDTVLHLCLHAVVQHRVRLGLRSLCDLAQVTESWEASQWTALACRATEYDLVRPVYLMLALSAQVLGLDGPASVMSALRSQCGAALPDDIAGKLLHLECNRPTAMPVAVVQASAKNTFPARARHFLHHLFLPRDGMAVVYGIPADSPRIWLTYLQRPVDLLRRYGSSVWGVLCGAPDARAAWQREVWLQRWLQEGK